jgi:hypothetical protein
VKILRSTPLKPLVLAAVTVGLLLLLACFIPNGSNPEALGVTVLGSTNGPSGSPMALVRVTNYTGHARCFYFAAEVSTPTGWADKRGWVQQHGRTQRVAAHSAGQSLLPVPEGAAKWRFRCSSWLDAGKVEWTWYRLLRRTGLSRLGFREQPPGDFCWTQVIQ